MTNTKELTADGTIILTITIPWADIKKEYDAVVEETARAAQVSGFRKGKAPKEMVEGQIDKTKTYEETIKRLVPKVYTEAVTYHSLSPIIMPQIELKEAAEGKDWIILAKTCERPKITLKDYKKAVADLVSSKKNKIIVPGKDAENDKKPSIDDLIGVLLPLVDATIPEILLENEVTHQLSQLVDQTKKLGLTVDQYLTSTGKTTESIRAEYKTQAARNLTLEFALETISDTEKISVSDEEVNKIIQSAKSDEERKNLEGQRYYLTSLLRRQKTVDMLLS